MDGTETLDGEHPTHPVPLVVEAIAGRPRSVNVIATGRDAPAELVQVADTVSEVRSRCRRLQSSGGLAAVFIDYLRKHPDA